MPVYHVGNLAIDASNPAVKARRAAMWAAYLRGEVLLTQRRVHLDGKPAFEYIATPAARPFRRNMDYADTAAKRERVAA